jgi:LytR cell envelope-related transcriptional attenuator
MIRGGKVLMVSGSLAIAGCVATHDVKVRAIADPAAKFRYGGGLIAEARAQLALGNAGLALETFRKAQREQPESADAFAGIAACYAVMGRYDLARTNYEFALAYAPTDPALLNALASSLDRLGESEQAAQVRGEATRLPVPSMAQARAEREPATPLGVPKMGSVTVRLPAAKIAAELKPVAIPIASPQLTAAAITLPAAHPDVRGKPTLIANVKSATDKPETTPALLAKQQAIMIVKPQLTAAAITLPAAHPIVRDKPTLIANVKSATDKPHETTPAPLAKQEAMMIAKPQLAAAAVSLPVARPAVLDRPAHAAKVEVASPVLIETQARVSAAAPAREAPMPADKPRDIPAAQFAVRTEAGAHMERLSTGEVALITNPGSVWIAQSAPRKSQQQATSRTASAATVLNLAQTQAKMRPVVASAVRWVPLKFASAPGNIQILNAARSQGLAARMRVALLNHGWRKVGIGDARSVRQRSLVLYSPKRAATARRLAAQFRCKAVKVQGIESVVVLLGRDTVSTRRAPAPARA